MSGIEALTCSYLASTHNQRINITVLLEALCPDCQRWIVEELYPHVFKNFMDFVNIEFVPYGNARIVVSYATLLSQFIFAPHILSFCVAFCFPFYLQYRAYIWSFDEKNGFERSKAAFYITLKKIEPANIMCKLFKSLSNLTVLNSMP